jgi:lysophospholipase L1-like esterase
MPYLATNFFLADGVQTQFDFAFAGVNPDTLSGTVPYLYPEDVRAVELYFDIDGNAAAADRVVTLVAPNRAQIDGAPVAAGRTVKIFRRTENRFPLVDYRDRQSVSEADLDLANRQNIFVAQEALDAAQTKMVQDDHGNFDAGGQRIVNLHNGIDPQDAVAMVQLNKMVRVTDTELPALPAVASRAGKLLGFDAFGNPVAVAPADGSAAELAMNLALPSGSGMVGHGGSTVGATLTSHTATLGTAVSDIVALDARQDVSETHIDQLRTRFAQLASIDNQLVDLHYGVCMGVGYHPSEVGTFYQTAAVQTGNYTCTIASSLGFLVNQLVVFKDALGDYYTNVIIDLTGLTITFAKPIQSTMGAGSVVSNFYNDYIHPNLYGYRAIADYALRKANRTYTRVKEQDLTATIPVAGGVQSSYTDNTYRNPGGVNSPSILTVAPGIGSGWKLAPFTLPAGDYILRLRINTSANGAGLFAVGVHVNEVATGADVGVLNVQSLFPREFEIPFHARKGGSYVIQIQGTAAGQVFGVSKADILQVTAKVKNFDYGKHVLLGDSWFNLPGVFERLQEKMPNATIINKGVQGHKMIDMLARFGADVEVNDPDFVWLMCGTNDYVANVAPVDFYTYFGQISSRTRAMGAGLISFNSSVGPISHPVYTDQLLRRSRALVGTEEYLPEI